MSNGALRPSGRIRERRTDLISACLLVAGLALAGCGFFPSDRKTESPLLPSAESPAPALAQDEEFKGFASIPVPANSLSAAGPLELTPGGSLGALGVNLDTYFAGDVEDTEGRIDRVERVVVAMQRDLKTLAPPIQRLLSVERDIQALVTQLTELAQSPAPPPQAAGPPEEYRFSDAPSPGTGSLGMAAQPPAPASPDMTAAPPSPGTAGRAAVRRLRVGEHPGATRIVLDSSAPALYRVDLDNGENLLLIELPDAGWDGPVQETLKKSPLIAAYTVLAEDGGSRVIVQLKKKTEVVYETVIPSDGKNDFRIVLDLKK